MEGGLKTETIHPQTIGKRRYEDGEFDKIADVIWKTGGVLYCVRRKEDGKYFYSYSPTHWSQTSSPYYGQAQVQWADDPKEMGLGVFGGSGLYLTEEDARRDMPKFFRGGCRCCGHGSTDIETEVVAVDFSPQMYRRNRRNG